MDPDLYSGPRPNLSRVPVLSPVLSPVLRSPALSAGLSPTGADMSPI